MATVATNPAANRLYGLCVQYLRAPFDFAADATTGAPVFTFTPALSPTEQATFDDLALMAKLGITTDLSLAEFGAIKPALAEIRTFRQRSLATWNGLTAAQREADEISYLNDLADVLRALLRT